jgi:hypothetical protein
MLNSEQKILGLISHLGIFLGFPVLAPLLIFLLSNDNIIKNQAKEALVFQIGLIIAGAVGSLLVLVLIGIPILIIIGIIGILFPIVAAVKFYQDGYYSYPITGNFLKKL